MPAADSTLLPDAAKRRLLGLGEAAQEGGGVLAMSTIGLPVVEGGRIRNYVFVRLRLKLAPEHPPATVRVKEPHIRDALVRAAHRRPFTLTDDWTRLNEAMIKAAVQAAADVIVGRGVVVEVEITDQAPRRQTGVLRGV